MPYSRYEDALHSQSSLLDSYYTPFGMNYLSNLFDDLNAKHKPIHRRDTRTLVALQMKALIDGEPVWVSQEAAEIIDHARHSFEPETIMPYDPFVPNGFALLSKPLIVDDAPRTEMSPGRSNVGIPIRAVAWISVHNEDMSQGCFWVSHYIHHQDEIQLGDDRWDAGQSAEMIRRMPLSLVHMYQMTWGTNPFSTELDDYAVLPDDVPEAAMLRARQQQQMIQTLWRIGSQFVPAKSSPLRQLRRQIQRKGRQHHTDVNVITLRRNRDYEPPEEGSGRHLTVQFPVHGYWAKRHKKTGTEQVWVKPHMKGPTDGELVVKDRAWEFTR